MIFFDSHSQDASTTLSQRFKSPSTRTLSLITAPWASLMLLEVICLLRPKSTISIVMIIVELASVLIFIWQPLLGSIIILIIWCVAYIIPVPTPSTYIAAGLMAIGVIGYINLILSICIAGLFIGLKLGISAIPALEIPYPTATFTFMLLMTMITCAALGCIVRLLQQQRREQEYLRQQEQQRSIAADYMTQHAMISPMRCSVYANLIRLWSTRTPFIIMPSRP